MLGTLLVVTSARDTDTETVRNALDSLLPDLLVQQRVDADILGSLSFLLDTQKPSIDLSEVKVRYHSLEGEGLDLLDGLRSPLLEAGTEDLEIPAHSVST